MEIIKMTADPFYRSATWKALRAAVLKRDPMCKTPGCGRKSIAVDHIIERRRGGADSMANLRGLCAQCHNQRSRGGEPRAKGCHADGSPRDPGHWWNAGKSLGAGSANRCGVTEKVSFGIFDGEGE